MMAQAAQAGAKKTESKPVEKSEKDAEHPSQVPEDKRASDLHTVSSSERTLANEDINASKANSSQV